MSDDTVEKKPEILTPVKNRKERRMEAAKLRKQPKEYRSWNHWYLRIMNEMKENKSVQEKLVDGTFDRFLPQTEAPSSET